MKTWIFNYRKLVPVQPGSCNCTKCLIVFSTVLYQSLHTSIEFWKQIFTYIHTYAPICIITGVMNMIYYIISDPTTRAFPVSFPAVPACCFKSRWTCTCQLWLSGNRGFRDFSGRKASVLLPNFQWVLVSCCFRWIASNFVTLKSGALMMSSALD